VEAHLGVLDAAQPHELEPCSTSTRPRGLDDEGAGIAPACRRGWDPAITTMSSAIGRSCPQLLALQDVRAAIGVGVAVVVIRAGSEPTSSP